MNPTLQTRIVPVATLATGTTIIWHGNRQELRWGRYLGSDPINHLSYPLTIDVKVAPGHPSWAGKIQFNYAGMVQEVLNPEVLPPSRRVLTNQAATR